MFQFEYQGISFAHKIGFASSPKDEFDKHIHHFYEVMFFIRGQARFHVDESSLDLKPFDCVLVRPGQYHFAEINRDLPYERYVCKMAESDLPPSLAKSLSTSPSFYENCEDLLPLLDSLNEFASVYQDDDMRVLCLSHIHEFLIKLTKKPGNASVAKKNPIVQAILSYIDEHLKEALTLEGISAALSYSPSYIAKSFQEEMKIPLMSYIRGKKLMGARTLMEHGLKAKEAASMMGFQDYSTFYRAYKKHFEEAPFANKK